MPTKKCRYLSDLSSVIKRKQVIFKFNVQNKHIFSIIQGKWLNHFENVKCILQKLQMNLNTIHEIAYKSLKVESCLSKVNIGTYITTVITRYIY